MAGSAACRLCGRRFEAYGGRRRVYCKECAARADKAVASKPALQCRECGGRFSAPSRSTVYCSDACRTDGTRRYNREYRRRYLTDPEKRAMATARNRAAAAVRRARRRGGRPPQRQRLPRADPNAEPSVCALCGRSFGQYGHTNRHTYCKRCTAKADREITKTVRAKCRECGKGFSTTNRAVRYCSDKCRADGSRRAIRESRRRSYSDPEKGALVAARRRARGAARMGGEAGGR